MKNFRNIYFYGNSIIFLLKLDRKS